MLNLIKIIGVLVLVVLIAFSALLAYLTVFEYDPDSSENLEVTASARHESIVLGEKYKIISYNTGYSGLDRTQDYFMDGGKTAGANNAEIVKRNMNGNLSSLTIHDADIYLLQEVDVDSNRSFKTGQVSHYRSGLAMNSAYAMNYRCDFVPIPWPPIGKVTSGIQTLTNMKVTSAQRISLPVPFKWPLSIANLKRCLLVERIDIADSDKELVIINLHLEAYDDGVGREAQLTVLKELLEAEYKKRNYVIAGGDFNASFPGDEYEQIETGGWIPGKLTTLDLPGNFFFVDDKSAPSARSLKTPYNGDRKTTQFYSIDGYIISNNITVNHIETIDLNFQYSDHQPVFLEFTLKQ